MRPARAITRRCKSATDLAVAKVYIIFVSHFESDECGGLIQLLDRYPDAKVICSEVTARQLAGFGYQCSLDVKKPSEHIITDSFDLEFIGYPSEMHLWEGLLAYEHKHKIFFSSDLMIRRGETDGSLICSNRKNEVSGISSEQVPDPQRLLRLQEELSCFTPDIIATGHGPVIDLR